MSCHIRSFSVPEGPPFGGHSLSQPAAWTLWQTKRERETVSQAAGVDFPWQAGHDCSRRRDIQRYMVAPLMSGFSSGSEQVQLSDVEKPIAAAVAQASSGP